MRPNLVPLRSVRRDGSTTTIKNEGELRKRILVGIPTLGTIRIEWDIARRSIAIPINWSSGEMISSHAPDSVIAQGYTTPDAQNVIAEQAIKQGFEWLLLYEDDVLPPGDAFIALEQHMTTMMSPIIAGLYFSKGNPSWPLVFRGRGNGAFTAFMLGDLLWVDGVHTGFTMIHKSLLEWFWRNSPEYQLPDGRRIPRVFENPNTAWYDPEQDQYFARMGTSDLFFCDRILKENVLAKTGWADLAKKPWPFVCDTHIFCGHIDIHGQRYPEHAEAILTGGKAARNGNLHKHRA